MNFKFERKEFALCQKYYNALDPKDALFLTHYELSEKTGFGTPQLWKEFLLDERVDGWIKSEVQVYTDAQRRKLIKDVNDNQRSVGAAQMLNALNKTVESDDKKEGELIVYSYVPANSREQLAPNFKKNDSDLFR